MSKQSPPQPVQKKAILARLHNPPRWHNDQGLAMNAITELKEAATWGVTAAMPTATSETAQSEITQLLREIRDLQKAHFERYREFTAKIMDAEATRRQDVLRLQIEQLRHQEASRAAAFQRQLLSWIVWAGVVVFCFGGI